MTLDLMVILSAINAAIFIAAAYLDRIEGTAP
jgi:hypothetical protein